MSIVTWPPGMLLEWHHGWELSRLAGSGRKRPVRSGANGCGNRTWAFQLGNRLLAT